MALKTQGTDLFFVDPDTNDLIKVGCPTAITGPSSTIDQVEITCLDDTARAYMAGLATPGTASFTVQFDPSDTSHVRLYNLKNLGTTLDWVLALSDGTALPTVDTAGALTLPTTRTYILFDGFVNDYPIDIQLNAVVTSNISIQVSGQSLLNPKTT